ncbi:MAG: glutamine amidotransferase, partial [Planctomycetota bacterium]|nr:glutamine amidotransferase [Planctomycetota bacterium]
YSLSEIVQGLPAVLPELDGYVVTGPKGGLNQVVLASHQADPILATCQAGLGRCAAFTSSIDSRWASNWLEWPGFDGFWEQAIRWAGKPSQSSDCEVSADIQGRDVTVNVEAIDAEGKFMRFANIEGQVISPDVSSSPIELTQVGPGQYNGQFQAVASGSYIVNLRYKKGAGDEKTHFTHTTVTIPFAPEFRDLTDNAPLLAEVSEITGGRILGADPNQANLFDYEGLKFPQTQMPLLRPLMFVWLVLFLLDVATRRVVLDFRAIARRAASVVRLRKGEHKTDKTLERLQARRQKLRDQLDARKAAALASRRYQASAEYEGELPVADTTRKARSQPEKEVEKPAPARAGAGEGSEHIQRLLKAKRKVTDSKPNDEIDE